MLCQGGQEHSDNDTNLEHEGPYGNGFVFVHDGNTFRAAALILRPLASSRYGARVLCLLDDEDWREACYLVYECDFALSLTFDEPAELWCEHDEHIDFDEQPVARLCVQAVILGDHCRPVAEDFLLICDPVVLTEELKRFLRRALMSPEPKDFGAGVAEAFADVAVVRNKGSGRVDQAHGESVDDTDIHC